MATVYILAVVGVALLIFGSEIMVRGAKDLSRRLGLSELVIGLTVVAFGTSSPELAVTMYSGFQGSTGLAAGNIMGSNICNILLILGAAALCRPLLIDKRLLIMDVPAMLLMTGLFTYFAIDGEIVRSEGFYLFAALVLYIGVAIGLGYLKRTVSFKTDIGNEPPLALKTAIAYLVGGLFCLVLGSNWVVNGAVEMARQLGVSEATIGLTVVAIGTSLPELAVSLVAAIRKQAGMALGNVIGSNLFNLGGVMGLTVLVIPGTIPLEGSSITFDLPVMVLTSIALLPIMVSKISVGRFEGALLLGWYGLILAYTALTAQAHHTAPILGQLMVYVVGPATVFLLLYFLFFRPRKDKNR